MASPDLRSAVRTGAAHLETMAAELAALEAAGRVTEPGYADLQHRYEASAATPSICASMPR